MQRVNEGAQRAQRFHRAMRRVYTLHSGAYLGDCHPCRDIRHAPIGREDGPHILDTLASPAVDPDLSIDQRMEGIINGNRLWRQNVCSL